jgi:hypothetical protein
LVRPALAHLHDHIGKQTGKRGLKRKGLSVFNLEDVTPGRQNSNEGFTFRQGERTVQGNDSGTRKQLQNAFFLGSNQGM